MALSSSVAECTRLFFSLLVESVTWCDVGQEILWRSTAHRSFFSTDVRKLAKGREKVSGSPACT